MSERTFHALSIGFNSGLLRLDQDHRRHLIPGKKTPPVVHATNEVKEILNAAGWVGQAFAEMTLVQLCTHLNIQF